MNHNLVALTRPTNMQPSHVYDFRRSSPFERNSAIKDHDELGLDFYRACSVLGLLSLGRSFGNIDLK